MKYLFPLIFSLVTLFLPDKKIQQPDNRILGCYQLGTEHWTISNTSSGFYLFRRESDGRQGTFAYNVCKDQEDEVKICNDEDIGLTFSNIQTCNCQGNVAEHFTNITVEFQGDTSEGQICCYADCNQ